MNWDVRITISIDAIKNILVKMVVSIDKLFRENC